MKLTQGNKKPPRAEANEGHKKQKGGFGRPSVPLLKKALVEG